MKTLPHICLLFLFIVGAQAGLARTITVHSAADSGPGSLRQALIDAANGDTININAKLTIHLTSGELVVGKNLMIKGPGANGPTISGNATSRVFHIMPGATLTLDSLTITNGAASIELDNFPENAGGGIYSDHANLTLRNCVVTNSVARFGAGIFSSSKNGGSANLTIKDSTISNNSARDIIGYMGAYGGGIFSGGGFDALSIMFGPVRGESTGGSAVDYQVNFTAGQKYRITETAQPADPAEEGFNAIIAVIDPNGNTILDQDTLRLDSGDYLLADETVTFVAPVTGQYTVRVHPGISGGVPTFGHFRLQINTVSQRTANATLNLNNCTINGNSAESQGGGIFNDGFAGNATLTITNSVVSGNIANDGLNDYGYGGGIYNNGDSGNALVTLTNSTLSGNFANTWGGALSNNAISTTPPLGPITFGPVTGKSTGGSAVDYQINFTAGQKYVITEMAQPANPAENFDAIIAVIDPNGQTILDQDTYVDETVTFVAPVTGQYTVRVHPFYSNGVPTFGHFTLQINAAAARSANMTLNNCTISGNSITNGEGAGIFSVLFGDGMTSLVTLTKCVVTGNQSEGDTGGIYFQGELADGSAKLTVTSCSITNNFAAFDGAGIEVKQAAAELTNTDVSNNSVTTDFGAGGGIGIDDGLGRNGVSLVTMTNCTVTGNSARVGGGIETSGLKLNLINCTVRGNSAGFGGGIFNENGDASATVTLDGSTVSGNSAAGGGGGGIFNGGVNFFFGDTATIVLINSTVSGNSADFGGGILNEAFGIDDTHIGTGAIIVRNSTISGNTADFGGGIFTWGSNAEFGIATLDIANSIINAGTSGENLIAYEDGIITSQGYNLSSDAAGGNSTKGPGGLLNGPGDIRNTNPMLGPLKDNGGPTMTHALLDHSPALNAGDPNFNPYLFDPPLLYDQRGANFPRIVTGRVDIGAFEAKRH
jgi:hypothetical protein